MYDSSRFFVMTSDYCSEFISISDGTEAVKPLHDKYLMQGKNNANSNEKIDFVCPGGQNLILSANEIIKKARNSQNSSKFEALYKGDISGYASQSEADMAFCNMIAFWCGRDVELKEKLRKASIENIFTDSGRLHSGKYRRNGFDCKVRCSGISCIGYLGMYGNLKENS